MFSLTAEKPVLRDYFRITSLLKPKTLKRLVSKSGESHRRGGGGESGGLVGGKSVYAIIYVDVCIHNCKCECTYVYIVRPSILSFIVKVSRIGRHLSLI